MFWKKRTYLDYAAAVPVRPVAARAYTRALQAFGNPSSPHEEGREAKLIVEEARRTIARLTEVKPDDVIFTSGATEANALALFGLAKPKSHLLYLPSAHASIMENIHALEAKGVAVEPLPLAEGQVSISALKKILRKETILITMDAVCGETGTIWNTREVAHALKEYTEKQGTSAYLHVDASQAPRTEKILRAHFGANMLSFDASKVGAARGIGCLIASRTIPLVPLYRGGGQERGLRSGTESPALAAAFSAALTACTEERELFKTHALEVRRKLTDELMSKVTNIYINEGKEFAPHILNLSLPGRDTDYLVALLDEAGFAVSTRSACETDSLHGSRAVLALTGDAERAKATLRVSWGQTTSTAEIHRFLQAFLEAVTFIDTRESK